MGLEVNIRVTGRSFPNNWSCMRTSISQDEHDKTKMAHAESSSIKHALKSKILSSRQKQGLGDIPVDFTPRQSYPMTQEEKEKDERRRKSNRMSAKRSRLKQKTLWSKNEKVLCELETKHKQLMNTISEHETKKTAIISDLTNYLPEHRITEILLEKVDYNCCDKYPKTVQDTFGDIMEDTEASGDTGQTFGNTDEASVDPGDIMKDIEAFDDTGEASGEPGDILKDLEATGETDEANGILQNVLGVSAMSDFGNLQLSNDSFVNSAYHANFESQEGSIDNFDSLVVNALDTINNIFNSVDDNI